ncbi:phosphatidate cytidylyltransferase [Euhalothece natronophila Z-M001]|uniref:Phosphatidate cytidylyltransferase n=1 Tax=Euhalothece natronophila Z-M001 TaxID=522448 RepID=A0A5B8NSD6_9CHRO|nr:diacylglycerol/polyprenol kinase family protein [Euhalothece natronophila]QDZ41249.1 phosphatidate cytidylyltransferase [Euhalothece natronophila Z-M001]
MLLLSTLLFADSSIRITPLIIVVAFLGGIVLFAELLNRLFFSEAELTRKVVHIGSGNVILFAWWLQIPAVIGISASAIAAVTALLSYFLPILPSINSVGRKSLGTFFYALSIGILVASFFPEKPYYAAIGILTMAWGDGLAALVGQNFGRHPYQVLGSKKSWEGSATMAGVSYLISFLILLFVFGNCWQIWLTSIIVSIFATAFEAISQWGIDNFTVPMVSGYLSFFLLTLLLQ